MRLFVSILILTTYCFIGSATTEAKELVPKIKKLSKEMPARVLFIGNSHLYYNDSIHNHVKRILNAAKLKHEKPRYKSATISGSWLSDHNIASYLDHKKLRIKEGPFEVVILQGVGYASINEKAGKNFVATVKDYAEKIRETGGEPVLYMTHAFSEKSRWYDPEMTRKNEKLYVEAGNANNCLIIPFGLAAEEAYRQRPDLSLHKSFDGVHPNLRGSYLAAATTFATLYGQSPVGNTYDYYSALPKEEIEFLQKVAEKTVKEFFSRQ